MEKIFNILREENDQQKFKMIVTLFYKKQILEDKRQKTEVIITENNDLVEIKMEPPEIEKDIFKKIYNKLFRNNNVLNKNTINITEMIKIKMNLYFGTNVFENMDYIFENTYNVDLYCKTEGKKSNIYEHINRFPVYSIIRFMYNTILDFYEDGKSTYKTPEIQKIRSLNQGFLSLDLNKKRKHKSGKASNSSVKRLRF